MLVFTRNPKSRLLQLLFEVVESKMNRDRDADLEKQLRDARKENKYHLVQNYNNDLIRKSLKSQNNHNRLNIKEHKANMNLESITKKLEERNRKKFTQKVSHGVPLKSLAAPRRNEDLEIEIANPVESLEKGYVKDRGSNYSYAGHTASSNTTPNSNLSFSTNKSNRAVAVKEKAREVILQANQKLLMKNSLIQRLKKRTTSKASSKSNRSSFSREAQNNKLVSRQTAEPEAGGGRHDDRILHLTLNGAKHNTNLVQINNYINKPHREDSDSAGVGDSKSHRMSANSNASNVYSSKLKKTVKPEYSMKSKEMDIHQEGKKLRKEIQNPLKLQSKLPFAQPMLASIQNKNVLTLTQNLLQKRNRNE